VNSDVNIPAVLAALATVLQATWRKLVGLLLPPHAAFRFLGSLLLLLLLITGPRKATKASGPARSWLVFHLIATITIDVSVKVNIFVLSLLLFGDNNNASFLSIFVANNLFKQCCVNDADCWLFLKVTRTLGHRIELCLDVIRVDLWVTTTAMNHNGFVQGVHDLPLYPPRFIRLALRDNYTCNSAAL
jgi:hypothetical protein